jgi:hypothetical protein
MALTHIELLLGCASPVWMWCVLLASLPASSIPDSLRFLPHVGWITVGVGDAVVSLAALGISNTRDPFCDDIYALLCCQAAVVGSFYGRTKWVARDGWAVSAGWCVSPSVLKRSVEGSAGCLLGMLAASGQLIISICEETYSADY